MLIRDVNESLFSILELNYFCLHDGAYCVSVFFKVILVVELRVQKLLKPLVNVARAAKVAYERSD